MKVSDTPRVAFSVEDFIAKYGIETRGPQPYQDGRKWILKTCPFDTSHDEPSAAIFELNSGVLGFNCKHNSCKGKRWSDFRNVYEPGYRDHIESGKPRVDWDNRSNHQDHNYWIGQKDSDVLAKGKPSEPPRAWSVEDLLNLSAKQCQMLIEKIMPATGAVMLTGKQKHGKTILASQIAIAIAANHPLMDNYAVVQAGPVIVIEQDDTAGEHSFGDYLKASPVSVKDIPLRLFVRIQMCFGPEFFTWLEHEITISRSRFVVLDSYTALRPHRRPGGDIVKIESDELKLLDQIGKRTGCTILVLNHVSKGSLTLDWADQSTGTFSLGQAVEAQLHIARFKELPVGAPERLLQGQGRHMEEFQAVIRFRKETLDYTVILEGPAAPYWPEIDTIKKAFGSRLFTPKELYQETGISRAAAHRNLDRLHSAGVLKKRGRGEYVLEL
jgi:hypothetical protein